MNTDRELSSIGVLCAAIIACAGGSGQRAAEPSSGSSTAGSSPDAGPPPTPSGGTPVVPTDGGAPAQAPLSSGGFTFYGTLQGLSEAIMDVSPDEGGNVYVAGGDALYVKKRTDQQFLRFDASHAGLTQNCYATLPESDPLFATAISGQLHPDPPGPPILCPVISVAGAAPGKAAVGFQGIGTDGDEDADWAQDSGGMDVVAFNGTKVTLLRHVFIASPPHTVCADNGKESFADTCSNPSDIFWTMGRRKLRQVHRVVVNHDPSSPMYGDMVMAGTHATVTVLINNAAARGWVDRTVGQAPKWANAQDVWEHDHPAFYDPGSNKFLTGLTHAVTLQPGTGIPWVSNNVRTAWLNGYGADVSSNVWWLKPETPTQPYWIDIWPDPGTPSNPVDPLGPTEDNVESMSYCDDGTLWLGSSTHGLARFDPAGNLSYLSLPDPAAHNDNVYAVACDPSDNSLWIGLGWGGAMHLKDGQFTQVMHDPSLPAFTQQPVRSIQIDRWSTPRIVYFAFMPTTDSTGKIVRGGGVASYDGP